MKSGWNQLPISAKALLLRSSDECSLNLCKKPRLKYSSRLRSFSTLKSDFSGIHVCAVRDISSAMFPTVWRCPRASTRSEVAGVKRGEETDVESYILFFSFQTIWKLLSPWNMGRSNSGTPYFKSETSKFKSPKLAKCFFTTNSLRFQLCARGPSFHPSFLSPPPSSWRIALLRRWQGMHPPFFLPLLDPCIVDTISQSRGFLRMHQYSIRATLALYESGQVIEMDPNQISTLWTKRLRRRSMDIVKIVGPS